MGLPRTSGRPKAGPTWLLKMSTAAPAVKPTMTLCGTLSANAPTRAKPSKSCVRPTMKLSVMTN